MEISKGELKAIIDESVKAAVKAELGQYKVDKELHYQHHIFIESFMKWYSEIKSSFWKSLVSTLVPTVLIILGLGTVTWVLLKAAGANLVTLFK